jgi:microsomal epoxide hydrolase
MSTSTPRPFTLHVPDAEIAELRQRLARTRWPDEPPGEPWSTGTSVSYMEGLADYWQAGFDWRAWEAKLNGFRQFTANVGGVDVHFIHEPGRGPNPMPLLISHGWPGSVFEFHKLVPLLTEHFTVVAPSLPGYALSFQPGQKRFGGRHRRPLCGTDDGRAGLQRLASGRRLGRVRRLGNGLRFPGASPASTSISWPSAAISR